MANIKSFVKEVLAVARSWHRCSFLQTWNVEIDETCYCRKTCAFLAGVVGSGLVLPLSSVLALGVSAVAEVHVIPVAELGMELKS